MHFCLHLLTFLQRRNIFFYYVFIYFFLGTIQDITHLVVDSTLSDFHIYHYFQLIILFKNFIYLMRFDFYSMYPAICTFHSSVFKQNLRKLHCPCISTKVVLIYALDKMFSRKVLFSHKSNHCYNIFFLISFNFSTLVFFFRL